MDLSSRLTWLSFSAIALTAALATPPAPAQVNIGITIGTPPPPVRYEVRPVYPGQGYTWEDGFWQPYGGRYRWHRGIWVREPFPDAYFVRPSYDRDGDGYRMRPGHWEHRGRGHDEGRDDDRGYRKFKDKDRDEDGRGEYHHDNGKHKGHDKN